MPGGAASGQQGRQRECGGGDAQGAARLETVDHVVPPKVGLPVAMTWEQSEWLREFAQAGKDFHVSGARLEWPNPWRPFRPGECRRGAHRGPARRPCGPSRTPMRPRASVNSADASPGGARSPGVVPRQAELPTTSSRGAWSARRSTSCWKRRATRPPARRRDRQIPDAQAQRAAPRIQRHREVRMLIISHLARNAILLIAREESARWSESYREAIHRHGSAAGRAPRHSHDRRRVVDATRGGLRDNPAPQQRRYGHRGSGHTDTGLSFAAGAPLSAALTAGGQPATGAFPRTVGPDTAGAVPQARGGGLAVPGAGPGPANQTGPDPSDCHLARS